MDFDKRNENWQTMRDMLSKLMREPSTLLDAFSYGSGVGPDDWAKMRVYQERLFTISDLVYIEADFAYLLLDISETGNDKAQFLVEKALYSFVDEYLLSSINSLIEVSKTWRFDDYRAINFQQEVKEKMTELLNFYNEIYK